MALNIKDLLHLRPATSRDILIKEWISYWLIVFLFFQVFLSNNGVISRSFYSANQLAAKNSKPKDQKGGYQI